MPTRTASPNEARKSNISPAATPLTTKSNRNSSPISTPNFSRLGCTSSDANPHYLGIYQKSFDAFEKARLKEDEAEQEAREKAEASLAKGDPSGATVPTRGVPHPEIPLYVQILTYGGYALVTGLGYARDAFRKLFPRSNGERVEKGYAPMVRDFDDFYQRRFFMRIRDCWNRPIDSRPSRVIGVMERDSNDHNKTMRFTGRIIPAINLGSYNYLGFSDNFPYITNHVLDSIDTFGTGACAAAEEGGFSVPLQELERTIAAFLLKQSAVVCGMGFTTNFGGLPALFDKGTLVLSDQLNHASIVGGLRASGCKIQVFPHNHLEVLESIIENAIVSGQERTHIAWKRIVIVVEGVYSMEGDVIDLRRVVDIKKKYKCLLYIDEAHSIGALGATGRGVCEQTGVNPMDVDILMGTFTKSFGSIGGYVAGDADVIEFVRHTSSLSMFSDAIAPGCAQQALSVLHMLLGEDGSDIGAQRIKALADNARFFRRGLKEMGLTVYGEDCSPVVPIMIYMLGKMPAFSRDLLRCNIAVVVVGYPATPLLECRARLCVSASHTRADLQRALDAIREVAREYKMFYSKQVRE